MTSLSDTYDSGPIGAVWDKGQLVSGVAMFVFGATLLALGIVAATTDVFINVFDLGAMWETRQIGGVFAGMGVPAMIVGVVSVLPTSRRQRLGTLAGLTLSLFAVFMFVAYFPEYWNVSDGTDYTLRIITVYSTGLLIMLSYLFLAVANFKTRNDPGGTVNLQLSIDGEAREVEVDRNQLDSENHRGILRSMDSAALDDSTETQTARQYDD